MVETRLSKNSSNKNLLKNIKKDHNDAFKKTDTIMKLNTQKNEKTKRKQKKKNITVQTYILQIIKKKHK